MPRKKKETPASAETAADAKVQVIEAAVTPDAPPPPPLPMAFALPLDDLKNAVDTVAAAVAARSTLPVLGGILIACETDGWMRIAATNLELGITRWVRPALCVAGGVVVPANTLQDALGKMPAKPVEGLLTTRTVTLALSAGRTKFNFKGIPAEEFPLIPVLDTGKALPFKAEDLIATIKRVFKAAATDEARPILTGIHLKLDAEGDLHMESADGFRLHQAVQHSTVHGQQLNVVVPARALDTLVKKFTGDEDILVDVPVNRGQIIFAQGDTQIVSQLIEGSFPDLSAVIPKNHIVELKLGKAGLIKSLQAADVVAREAAHTVRIKPVLGTDEQPGHLEIVATSAETGDYRDSDLAVDITLAEGGASFEFAVNDEYMVDLLKASPDEQAVIHLQAATSPIKLTATDFVGVCMPMSIGK